MSGTPGGAPPARLPGSLAANPRLAQWLRLCDDGTVRVTPGKVEIGQGITTALARIVADELALPLEHVRMVPVSTASSPNEAVTAGSLPPGIVLANSGTLSGTTSQVGTDNFTVQLAAALVLYNF